MSVSYVCVIAVLEYEWVYVCVTAVLEYKCVLCLCYSCNGVRVCLCYRCIEVCVFVMFVLQLYWSTSVFMFVLQLYQSTSVSYLYLCYSCIGV